MTNRKRKPRKLTPEIAVQIRARHAHGASYRTLASAFGLSLGTVRAALTSAPPTSPAETPPPAVDVAPCEAGAPMTRDELVSFLASQARALKAEIEASTEPALRATLTRQLTVITTLLSRSLPPPPPDPNVGTFVDAGTMRELGEQVAKRLHKMIDLVAAETV